MAVFSLPFRQLLKAGSAVDAVEFAAPEGVQASHVFGINSTFFFHLFFLLSVFLGTMNLAIIFLNNFSSSWYASLRSQRASCAESQSLVLRSTPQYRHFGILVLLEGFPGSTGASSFLIEAVRAFSSCSSLGMKNLIFYRGLVTKNAFLGGFNLSKFDDVGGFLRILCDEIYPFPRTVDTIDTILYTPIYFYTFFIFFYLYNFLSLDY